MGITMLTAMIIASNDDLIIDAGGPSEEGESKGKYVGWIMKNEDRWAPLLNTEPIYDTAKEAKKAMRDLVKECKKIVAEKTGGKDPIEYLMGDTEEAGTVRDIIDAAKKD